MTNPVDYKKILRAYIIHVLNCESVDYIKWSPFKIEGLTEEEIAKLERLSEEIK